MSLTNVDLKEDESAFVQPHNLSRPTTYSPMPRPYEQPASFCRYSGYVCSNPTQTYTVLVLIFSTYRLHEPFLLSGLCLDGLDHSAQKCPVKDTVSPLELWRRAGEAEVLNRLQSPDNQTELEERSGSPHSPHEMGWISSLLLLTFSTLSRIHQNPRGRSELSLARVPIWCLHQPACLYIPGSDEGSIPRSHHSANLLFGDSAPAGCCVGKFPSRLSFILGAHGFHPVDLELNMFHFCDGQ